MGDLTRNFSRSEFECKDFCGFDDISMDLVWALQAIREAVGLPVHVSSGCRCEAHNAAEGGVDDSRHTYGDAADIWVKNMNPVFLAGFVYAIKQTLSTSPRNALSKIRTLIPNEKKGYMHVDLDPKEEYFAGFPKGEK